MRGSVIVIPKAVRDLLDLRPVTRGDELLGMFAGGPSMTAELEAEHRAEIERDERREAALDAGRMW